ncbi:MAG: HEPN domain-containing protein [Armatimonadetes bacterium]|nr:HEPN domain-containing protein [Armatimonadota bacterium]
MTEDNKLRNIAAEVSHSDEALAAARHLHAGGFHRDAVSRSYYAAYHLARALLLSEDQQPRTHSGTTRMLGLHFIRPGILPSRYSRLLSLLQSEREGADYESAFDFGEEDALRWLSEVESFGQDVKSELRRRGYLPALPS